MYFTRKTGFTLVKLQLKNKNVQSYSWKLNCISNYKELIILCLFVCTCSIDCLAMMCDSGIYHCYMISLMSFQFKYGTCFDYFLMILGSFCAVCHGAALPSMIIVFGDMTDTFVNSGIYYSWLQSISAYLSSVGISITDAVANPSILRY